MLFLCIYVCKYIYLCVSVHTCFIVQNMYLLSACPRLVEREFYLYYFHRPSSNYQLIFLWGWQSGVGGIDMKLNVK